MFFINGRDFPYNVPTKEERKDKDINRTYAEPPGLVGANGHSPLQAIRPYRWCILSDFA